MRRGISTLRDVEALDDVPLDELVPFATVGALLEAAAEAHADLPAWRYVSDPRAGAVTRQRSYQELVSDLRRAARLWRRLGAEVTPGQRPVVAYCLPHVPAVHEVLWSAECAGVAVPINPFLQAQHIAQLLDRARAGILVVDGGDEATLAELPRILAAAGGVRAVLTVRDGTNRSLPALPVPVLDWADAVAAESDELPLTEWEPDAPQAACAYVHTGGTTGLPKLAVQHHRGQTYVNALQARLFDIGPGSVVFAAMPLYHVAGMTLTGLSVLGAGGCLLMPAGGWRNREVVAHTWRMVERHAATHLSLVPTVLQRLTAVPLERPLRSLRYALCGAAPLPAAAVAAFESHTGVPVLQGYGATELHCIVSQNPPDAARPDSVGLRMPHSEVRLDDAGQILVRGPHVFGGYLGPAGSGSAVDADGWYATGDLGRLDEDGHLHVTGRLSDLVIRGGHNLDPVAVESLLATHPAVATAVVVGRPHPDLGEVPVAYVVLRPGASADTAELLAFLDGAGAERAALPDWIEVVPQLPMTAVGKVQRQSLRRRAGARTVRELLASAGIEGQVDEVAGPGDGELRVTVAGPAHRERVEELLRALPVAVSVNPPPVPAEPPGAAGTAAVGDPPHGVR